MESNKKQRRSCWHSSLAALQFINECYRGSDAKTRKMDHITNILIILAITLTTFCILFPKQNQILYLFSDFFIGTSIIFYIVNRFGIVTTLDKRQAVLIAELLLGFICLGLYIASNFAGLTIWIRSVVQIH